MASLTSGNALFFALMLMTVAAAPVQRQRAKHASGSCLRRTPLHLFACHVEWCSKGKLDAYQELIAALDDPDDEIRSVAENLLHRSSPRRQLTAAGGFR
jgi:hypothetical protein